MKLYSHEYFMDQAYRQAQMALDKDEVPIGAVIVSEQRIIARCHNMTEMLNDPTAHAEILAITSACNYLGNKYLQNCTIYTTLEPCMMCAGALYWSRIKNIFYAAPDLKNGFNSSTHVQKTTASSMVISEGILREKCSNLLSNYFKNLRKE